MTTTAAHRRARAAAAPAPAVVRVVAYCRRSVEKVVDEFGSIENQRSAIASYVASQRERGWTLLPTGYEDRNLSGATTDRPGLHRLLADAEARRFEVVCLYKFDRISRSLADFLGLVRRLETLGITVVSVTQQVDTSTSTGRLMLNILASFAEFEREQASERVADKMLAARQRGRWQGGRPSLGFDVVAKKLVVNTSEAADVIALFETFARTRSLVGTLHELERRGIRNKSWTGKRGQRVKGAAFTKNSLTHLLGNVLYRGQIRAGDEVVQADHEAIVPEAVWDAVQAIFAEGKIAPGRPERQSWSALLTGLLKCGACGSSMVPTYSVKGARRYGYYQCQRTKSQGAAACHGSRAAQDVVEAAVVERLMAIGRDPSLVAEAVQAAHAEVATRRAELAQDARRLGTAVHSMKAERDELVAATAREASDGPELRSKLDAVRDALREAQDRAAAVRDDLAALKASDLDEDALRRAIESFTPVWDALFPAERARLIRLLVERLTFDARTGEMAIAFHASGIAELASQGADA
jgi:site-specific DNA recombinase